MQTPDHERQPEQKGTEAPPRLVSALKQVRRAPIFVPRTLDEAILRAAQQHLGKPAPQSRPPTLVAQVFNLLYRGFSISGSKEVRLIRWLAAAAAVLLLAAVANQVLRRPAEQPNSGPITAREDINRERRIDILDAFALARQLKSGTKPNATMDVNGDGVVDERDVTALAAQAVKLEKGGNS
jgi:hypothetical protein